MNNRANVARRAGARAYQLGVPFNALDDNRVGREFRQQWKQGWTLAASEAHRAELHDEAGRT